jgi:hypothetical protein
MQLLKTIDIGATNGSEYIIPGLSGRDLFPLDLE